MRRERKKIYICEWERRENIGALDSKKKLQKRPKTKTWKLKILFCSRRPEK